MPALVTQEEMNVTHSWQSRIALGEEMMCKIVSTSGNAKKYSALRNLNPTQVNHAPSMHRVTDSVQILIINKTILIKQFVRRPRLLSTSLKMALKFCAELGKILKIKEIFKINEEFFWRGKFVVKK